MPRAGSAMGPHWLAPMPRAGSAIGPHWLAPMPRAGSAMGQHWLAPMPRVGSAIGPHWLAPMPKAGSAIGPHWLAPMLRAGSAIGPHWLAPVPRVGSPMGPLWLALPRAGSVMGPHWLAPMPRVGSRSAVGPHWLAPMPRAGPTLIGFHAQCRECCGPILIWLLCPEWGVRVLWAHTDWLPFPEQGVIGPYWLAPMHRAGSAMGPLGRLYHSGASLDLWVHLWRFSHLTTSAVAEVTRTGYCLSMHSVWPCQIVLNWKWVSIAPSVLILMLKQWSLLLWPFMICWKS